MRLAVNKRDRGAFRATIVIVLVIELFWPPAHPARAFQSSSTNFVSPDSTYGIFGKHATSTGFTQMNAGGQTITGVSASASFRIRFGHLYFDGFTPRSQNWRWYGDADNETPANALADENAAPSDVDNQQTVKLRIVIKEMAGIGSLNHKFKLQYSETSDFSQGVNDLVEIGSCTASSTWCYANGGGLDNAAITAKVLSDAGACAGGVGSGCGTHNTSSLSISPWNAPSDGATEYEFTLKNAGAQMNLTYFFRPFDVINNRAVSANTGKNYPSLSTKGATLVFSVNGLPLATSTQGIVTDVSTTPMSISFGSLNFDAETEAAQRITVTANSTEGYQVFIFQDQGLVSEESEEIVPVSGTNESPAAWSIPQDSAGAFGYHSGDPTLFGGSTRFAPNNTYARLESAPKEIAFNYSPVTNESTDVVFKVQITNQQTAADYTQSITYIVVPTF